VASLSLIICESSEHCANANRDPRWVLPIHSSGASFSGKLGEILEMESKLTPWARFAMKAFFDNRAEGEGKEIKWQRSEHPVRRFANTLISCAARWSSVDCSTRRLNGRLSAWGESEMRSKFRIRDATQTDLKSEFERRGHTDWQWAMTALVAFAILDYLCLGLKVMK
jgi:hypothetical protein